MKPHPIANVCCMAVICVTTACCRLLPGKAVLVTDREQYTRGDEATLTLCNRSGRVVGNLLSKVSLQRRSGSGTWEVVRFPTRGRNGKTVEIALLEGVEPCAQEEANFRLPPSLPPGRYRFSMPALAGEHADFEHIEGNHAVSETFIVTSGRGPQRGDRSSPKLSTTGASDSE